MTNILVSKIFYIPIVKLIRSNDHDNDNNNLNDNNDNNNNNNNNNNSNNNKKRSFNDSSIGFSSHSSCCIILVCIK